MDAQEWLATMGYSATSIKELTPRKPHGEKADVEVLIKTREGEKTEGISIKLVSTSNGFNQIDKLAFSLRKNVEDARRCRERT